MMSGGRGAPSLKTVEEATADSAQAVFCVRTGGARGDGRKKARNWLTFVIVGAGVNGDGTCGALGGDRKSGTLKHVIFSQD